MANLADLEAMVVEDGDDPVDVADDFLSFIDNMDEALLEISEKSPKGSSVIDNVLLKQQKLMDFLGIKEDISEVRIDDFTDIVTEYPDNKELQSLYYHLRSSIWDVIKDYLSSLVVENLDTEERGEAGWSNSETAQVAGILANSLGANDYWYDLGTRLTSSNDEEAIAREAAEFLKEDHIEALQNRYFEDDENEAELWSGLTENALATVDWLSLAKYFLAELEIVN